MKRYFNYSRLARYAKILDEQKKFAEMMKKMEG